LKSDVELKFEGQGAALMIQRAFGMAVVVVLLYVTLVFAAAQFAAVLAAQAQVATASTASPSLDYEFFKSRVEPIFLKTRGDHAPCYACHSENANLFHLARLSPGSKFWTEEQSRSNFQSASRVAVPGDPNASHLLLHPLAPEAGGDPFHSGGRQFSSKDDPDWKILADWVRGQKVDASAGPAGNNQ
jgi:hypothetical protein